MDYELKMNADVAVSEYLLAESRLRREIHKALCKSVLNDFDGWCSMSKRTVVLFKQEGEDYATTVVALHSNGEKLDIECESGEMVSIALLNAEELDSLYKAYLKIEQK